MMTSKTSEPCIPPFEEVCAFLSEYSSALLASGATCIRLEKNVSRIAATYNMDVDLIIMPRHINMSFLDRDTGGTLTTFASVSSGSVSYVVNTELSKLSWDIADGRIGYKDAWSALKRIKVEGRQNKWLVMILVSLANASFCRLYGGDGTAMAMVAAATATGFYFRQLLTSRHIDIRVTFIVCSFISSVIGASGILFSLGETPSIALCTSVLYLIPGIPLLNSFSDMLYRHYICAFSRFMDALVLTCCLSFGLLAAMLLMKTQMF